MFLRKALSNRSRIQRRSFFANGEPLLQSAHPITICIGIVPVTKVSCEILSPDVIGFMVARKRCMPFEGELFIPGGVVESTETPNEHVARSVSNITGLLFIPTYFKRHTAFSYESYDNGLLHFHIFTSEVCLDVEQLAELAPDDSVSELVVADKSTKFCSPIHNHILEIMWKEYIE